VLTFADYQAWANMQQHINHNRGVVDGNIVDEVNHYNVLSGQPFTTSCFSSLIMFTHMVVPDPMTLMAQGLTEQDAENVINCLLTSRREQRMFDLPIVSSMTGL